VFESANREPYSALKQSQDGNLFLLRPSIRIVLVISQFYLLGFSMKLESYSIQKCKKFCERIVTESQISHRILKNSVSFGETIQNIFNTKEARMQCANIFAV
jgi:hypothetical protein